MKRNKIIILISVLVIFFSFGYKKGNEVIKKETDLKENKLESETIDQNKKYHKLENNINFLIGIDVEEIKPYLNMLDLKYNITSEYNNNFPKGTVFKIVPNENITKDTEIKLYVSKGIDSNE